MKQFKILLVLVAIFILAVVGCSKRETPTQPAPQKIEPTEVAFGTVKVATIPAKGIVVFDGDTLGPAPVERDSLAPAPYVYQILSPDTAHQDSAEAFFEVKAGQNNLMVRLKLKSGEIEIDTTATDSAGLLAVYAVEYETEVPLSGVKVFTKEGWPAVLNPWPAINQNLTPINFNQVAPNSYTLVGIKSGYDTTAVSVIVEAGKSETAYLVMHKSATPDTTTPPDTTIVPPDTTQPCEQQGATFKAINDSTGEEITYVKVELDNGSGWKLYGPGYHWLEVGNYTARFTDDTGQYEGPVEEDFVIDSCQVTQVVVEMQKKTNDPEPTTPKKVLSWNVDNNAASVLFDNEPYALHENYVEVDSGSIHHLIATMLSPCWTKFDSTFTVHQDIHFNITLNFIFKFSSDGRYMLVTKRTVDAYQFSGLKFDGSSHDLFSVLFSEIEVVDGMYQFDLNTLPYCYTLVTMYKEEGNWYSTGLHCVPEMDGMWLEGTEWFGFDWTERCEPTPEPEGKWYCVHISPSDAHIVADGVSVQAETVYETEKNLIFFEVSADDHETETRTVEMVEGDTVEVNFILTEIPPLPPTPCFSALYRADSLFVQADILSPATGDTLVLNGSTGPLIKIPVRCNGLGEWNVAVDISAAALGGYVYTRFTLIYGTMWHYHSYLGCDPAEWSLTGISLEPENDQWFKINR